MNLFEHLQKVVADLSKRREQARIVANNQKEARVHKTRLLPALNKVKLGDRVTVTFQNGDVGTGVLRDKEVLRAGIFVRPDDAPADVSEDWGYPIKYADIKNIKKAT